MDFHDEQWDSVGFSNHKSKRSTQILSQTKIIRTLYEKDEPIVMIVMIVVIIIMMIILIIMICLIWGEVKFGYSVIQELEETF